MHTSLIDESWSSLLSLWQIWNFQKSDYYRYLPISIIMLMEITHATLAYITQTDKSKQVEFFIHLFSENVSKQMEDFLNGLLKFWILQNTIQFMIFRTIFTIFYPILRYFCDSSIDILCFFIFNRFDHIFYHFKIIYMPF